MGDEESRISINNVKDEIEHQHLGDAINEEVTREKLAFWKLIAISINFCGIFFAYSLQGVVIVPLFLSFGLTQSETSLVMLISPIAVIIVYPLVGVLSDQCTLKFGRRRPFLLLGTIIQILGFVLLAVAPDLGHLLGDPLPPTGTSGGDETVPLQIYSVIIGLFGFAFVDFAAGIMQLPSRAWLNDIAPIDQQTTGSALFAFWMSAGNAIGYLLGSVDWSQWTFFDNIYSSAACPAGSCVNYRVLFTYATFLDIVTVAITLILVHEIPLPKTQKTKSSCIGLSKQFLGMFKEMYDYVSRRMDGRTKRVLMVYFICWLSWPLWTFYISDWVGTEVYDGNPNSAEGTQARENYDDGVQAASFALFWYSVIAFIYSLILPWIIRIPLIGFKWSWAAAMVFHGLIYFALIAFRGKIYTSVLISLAGVNLATMHVVPWALVGFFTKPQDNGIAYAFVNVANALPSLILNGFVNPGLELIFSTLVPVMVFGGATMILSGLLVYFIKAPSVAEVYNKNK